MDKKTPSKVIPEINDDQIKDALKRSGYLLEQRAEHVFLKNRFEILNENYFIDEETSKLREIDLIAEKSDYSRPTEKRQYGGAFTYKFICECENNAQPYVFFQTKAKVPYGEQGLIYSQIPFSFTPKKQTVANLLWGDTAFSCRKVMKEHHLSRSKISTQYCSFAPKDKNNPQLEWTAFHLDEQHNTLTNLLKGSLFVSKRDAFHYENNMSTYYRKYQINLYYPVLILQNRLAVAKEKDNGEIVLEDREHVVFMKNHSTDGWEHLLMIDVIQEKYLPQYITKIHQEIHSMHAQLLRHPNLMEKIDSWEKDYSIIQTDRFMNAQAQYR